MTLAVARGHNPDASPRKLRWRTPRGLFDVADAEHHFDLDAAAEDGVLVANFISPAEDCRRVDWTLRGSRVWFNPPWGPRSASFPGTGAFVDRAIEMADRGLDRVVVLVPTAMDTAWYRRTWRRAWSVRCLRRVAFLDPDTMQPGEAPPGSGVTLFELRCIAPLSVVAPVFCDALGRAE